MGVAVGSGFSVWSNAAAVTDASSFRLWNRGRASRSRHLDVDGRNHMPRARALQTRENRHGRVIFGLASITNGRRRTRCERSCLRRFQ